MLLVKIAITEKTFPFLPLGYAQRPWIRWNNENLVGLALRLAAFTLFHVRDLDQALCPACTPL